MAEPPRNLSLEDDGPAPGVTAAMVLLARRKAVGIEYIFTNSGTDFPPLIEALAAGGTLGFEFP